MGLSTRNQPSSMARGRRSRSAQNLADASRCLPAAHAHLRRSRRPASRGFTLVELLVVISIIGVLISLTLPAVQSARDAARKLDCLSKIKQLALAVENFESATSHLPPSGLVDYFDARIYGRPFRYYRQQSGKMLSWAVLLLPYIEQQSLFARFDLDLESSRQPGEPQSTPVEAYLCPSDSAYGRMFSDSKLTRGTQFAKGNYAAYVSPFHVDLQDAYRGAMIIGGQALSKVTDPTSRTIVFGEVRTRDHRQDERGAWALPWNGASLLAFDMHDASEESGDVRGRAGFLAWDRRGGAQTPNYIQRLEDENSNRDVLQICPEVQEADVLGMPCFRHETSPWLSAAPRSLHPGGVNVAYLDGHAEFLTDDVDELVMAYLVSIDDEQSLSWP